MGADLFPELNVQLLASIPNGLWIEDMGLSDIYGSIRCRW